MQKGSKGAQADAAETISCNLTFDFQAGKEIVDNIQKKNRKMYEQDHGFINK